MDVYTIYLCLSCVANVTGTELCPNSVDSLCRPDDPTWKQ